MARKNLRARMLEAEGRALQIRAGAAQLDGASTAETRDYISATDVRFRAAWDALQYKGNKNWPVGEEDGVIFREFLRQWNEWQQWYSEVGQSALGLLMGYDKVQAFDINLSRVLRKAKKAGADISSVPPARTEDPEYKKEVEDENETTLDKAITLAKWGVIAYVAVNVGGILFRKAGDK